MDKRAPGSSRSAGSGCWPRRHGAAERPNPQRSAYRALAYARDKDEMYVFQGGSYTPDQIQDLFRVGQRHRDSARRRWLLGDRAAPRHRRHVGRRRRAQGSCDTMQVLCDAREQALPDGWRSTSQGRACRGDGLPGVPAPNRTTCASRDTTGVAQHDPANRPATGARRRSPRGRRRGTENRTGRAWPRSVSRCPPWAAGSMSTAPAGVPHDVAAPQVPVQPGRDVVIVEMPSRHRSATRSRHSPAKIRLSRSAAKLEHRQQPLVGVERTPARVRPQRHRQRMVQWPERIPVPASRRARHRNRQHRCRG